MNNWWDDKKTSDLKYFVVIFKGTTYYFTLDSISIFESATAIIQSNTVWGALRGKCFAENKL